LSIPGRGARSWGRMPSKVRLHLAGDPEADELLAEEPFALVVGMILDQQVPMQRAFRAPYLLAQRLGTPGRLDPAELASLPPDRLQAAFSEPPALHRFPAAMAERVRRAAEIVTSDFDGHAEALWQTAPDGETLRRRLQRLPGFGEQKARIFVALLAKQLGVTPSGWQEASAPFGEEGSFRSIADIVDDESHAAVQAYKRSMKAGQAGRSRSRPGPSTQ
jgi:uncharacterized HhH-GPD family protein